MCMLSIEIGGCVIYRNLITHNPLKQPITEHGPFMGIRYIYRIGYGGYYSSGKAGTNKMLQNIRAKLGLKLVPAGVIFYI